MQQKLEKRRGSFGAGLFASVALHVAIAALLLFRLAPAAPEPEKEETVKVEMVPEPEKKPAEKEPQKPAREPARETAEKPTGKPAEKPPAKAMPDKKPAEARKSPPQAFEAAAKQGEKEPAAGAPPEDKSEKADVAAAPPTGEKVPEKTEQQPKQEAKPAETVEAAKPPELSLPETASARQSVDEGLAVEKTAPKMEPKAETVKPETKPADVAKTVIVPGKSSGAGSQRPPAEMKKARELFSTNALSDPRVRQALGKLPKDRRIAQMCMVEALEQIRRASPDTVPEGLFFDPPKGSSPISGHTLNAISAAYRSGPAWYNIDFQCTVNDEADAISTFNFAIGSAVPKGQWKARRFPAD